MKHTPLTPQTGSWVDAGESPWLTKILGVPMRMFHRKVWDGRLDVLVGEEPIGWHLSISHKRIKPNGDVELRRYPTWDEIVHARDQLLPADRSFVMHLPKAGQFVALHDTTFHLHELHEETR